MSISGISSGPTVYQNYAPSPFQRVRKDFAALKTSLTSGDLKGTQAAFKTLTQDIQAIGQAQGGQQTGGTSPLDNDLAALGSALDSGKLSDAQNAFATLMQDLQQAQKTHHHHHHHGGSTEDTQNTTSSPFTDLAALGKALQSGDLSDAQNGFATLMQDLQNMISTLGNSTNQTVGAIVNVTA
jgi:hypothetical protein